MVRASERVKSDFARAVAAFDFPPALARAVLLLDQPAQMGCLATQMSCDQSYITRLADDLVKRGLATRAPGADRRVHVLTLTSAGQDLKAKLATAVSRESSVGTALTPTQQSELSVLLSGIVNAP